MTQTEQIVDSVMHRAYRRTQLQARIEAAARIALWTAVGVFIGWMVWL